MALLNFIFRFVVLVQDLAAFERALRYLLTWMGL